MLHILLIGFTNVYTRYLLKGTVLQTMNLFNVCHSLVGGQEWPSKSFLGRSFYSTLEVISNNKDKEAVRNLTLAKNLAFLVEESSNIQNGKPKSRMELRRSFELHIKKRVKEQHTCGKFYDLMEKVIANPRTLQDAYNCIRVNSNIDWEMDSDNLPFESMAEELCRGEFDVNANTFSISTKGANKEVLVLPNLKLKVVQEAIRIVLEVVYKPHFSKISHGCRSGRGHSSALKYISKEISNPDWWFSLIINQKIDNSIITKLISSLENKIKDPSLYTFIQKMFDAHVLNLEFGGFPKGHGLPQEGVLSPILMNIYLDNFDSEFCKMSMKYEACSSAVHTEQEESHSKLRSWFRRQMNGDRDTHTNRETSRIRIHSCRFMDEIFFVVSGCKEVAIALKSEIQDFFRNALHLDTDGSSDILPSNGPHGVRFLGILIKRSVRENASVRAVHKLKEKVKLFASQKRGYWDAGTVRIGKKWLAYGLKKVKESEIKQLADNHSLLNQISHFRKAGMETDDWFKVLLKVWMQDVNVRSEVCEEFILSRYVAEPALPPELRDSFYKFQKYAKEYVSSETASTLSLLPNDSPTSELDFTTEIVAPVNVIKKRLLRYGLTNSEGFPCTCRILIFQDPDLIIDWFSGIVHRWLRWYGEFDNFSEVKQIISDQVRKSCIRTLAAKYRIHELEIEKRFDSELSRIPSTQGIENDMENEELDARPPNYDEALMYGISYSGLCLLSLARIVSPSRPCTCFAMGCTAVAPCVYALHVMERQKFPGWKTGFSSCIHPSLNKRRIGLCKKHLKDLYLGHMSLQSIDFGAWR